MTRKPDPDSGLVLKSEWAPDSIVVRNYGRYPDHDVATYPGNHLVVLIAPNGRLYQVSLEGNALRVSAREGGIWVRPKADNVVEVVNLTPFERDVERAMQAEADE